MADWVEGHCPESSLFVFGVQAGVGIKGSEPTPALPEPYWAPDQGTEAEFNSRVEISSDWLPCIQAEALWSPSLPS